MEECNELLWAHQHKHFGVVSFQSFFFFFNVYFYMFTNLKSFLENVGFKK